MVEFFLYYVIAVEPNMLLALCTLEAAQSKGAEDTKESVDNLFDYCATNSDAKLRFHTRNMALHIHRNAYYISELHAISRT